jgi:hypothetical protein
MKKLKLGERGRKKKSIAIFVDFKRAFDSVDRRKLIEILRERIGNEGHLNLLIKLLQPQNIVMPDKRSSFR